MAASAWLIADSRNFSSQCHGVCEVAGPPDSINSYWAELQGMHSLLLYLNTMCKFFRVQSGLVLVACNNSTVIALCQYHGSSPPPDTSHLDLICSIWTLWDALPLSLTFCHVCGHQDDLVAVACLDPLAQINVGADTLAKEHQQSLISHGHMMSYLPLASKVWSCWLSSQKVIHDPHYIISHHLGIHSTKEYLIQKQLFSPLSFDLVNWPAQQSATASLPDQLAMWSASSSVAIVWWVGTCCAASNGITPIAPVACFQTKPHNMSFYVKTLAYGKHTALASLLYVGGLRA